MTSRQWWSDAEAAARRVIGARVRDTAERDDLVQETLTRLVAVRAQLDDDALVPYAIVTARNLSATHHRRAARVRFDNGVSVPEPAADEAAVAHAEALALRQALGRLDPADRVLLVERDFYETPIGVLARDTRATPGAVRARLTRLRAQARLEYALALRHLARLPTSRCRPTLEALASGDAVKLRRAGGDDHISECETCRSLEQVVRRRRRWLASIAGALGIPRLADAAKQHPVVTTSAVGSTAAAVVAGVLFAGPTDGSPRPPAPTDKAAATAMTRATTTTAQVLVNGAGWPRADPRPQPGDRVVGQRLVVVAVAGDETFTARTVHGDLVRINLVGHGESPVTIRAGMRVSINGTVRHGRPILDVVVPYNAVRAAR